MTTTSGIFGLNWLFQIVRPIETLNFAIEAGRRDVKELFSEYWAFPILLSVAINTLVYHKYGIDSYLNSTNLLVIVLSSLNVFVGAMCLYAALALSRARVELAQVLSAYTISVIYAPLLTFISIPTQLNIFRVMTVLQSKHIDTLHALPYFFTHPTEFTVEATFPAQVIGIFVSIIGSAVGLASTVLIAESLTQIARLERTSTYLAVCVSSWVSILPSVACVWMQLAIAYTYLG